MILSIVIPAHNEEKYLADTLDAASRSAREAGLDAGMSSPMAGMSRTGSSGGPMAGMSRTGSSGGPMSYEIIVADDVSTDKTAEIARSSGAIVVASNKRNIGATRNIGARVSSGKYILFLDADTTANSRALSEMLAALDNDAVAGGARLKWDQDVSLFGRFILEFWNTVCVVFHAPAGGFFFMRRDAFDRAGGFDESYFVGEELWLGRKLRKYGRVSIIASKVETSARKLKTHSWFEFAALFWKALKSPFRTMKNRDALNVWYVRRD